MKSPNFAARLAKREPVREPVPEPESVPSPVPATVLMEAAPARRSGKKKDRTGQKIISFWAPVAVWERFRHLATDERTTMDALLNEAATDFLARRGR